ncbi:FadR/GntR family transcriptional regulator [Prosthecodimorpha staleyi]|uniref:FCD domain-containing protein n=1 Tax=Prosthecodimorpha staleyi TaxID=2840188 RepID=A0A947DD81_9HYPH|nr:FCD domain-containing protein [Prosthecodimorpha staleyi]MBT9293234.1 FCD domain-containing protein [Prosthecodimorpha staleyi]
MAPPNATLAPLSIGTFPRSKKLVALLSESLEREIREGRLKPGDRLPTEAALSAAAGVSRTVVREAVAALKAAGLVETRQGAGAFVLQARTRFADLGPIERATVDEIVWILELRLAVEVEAAALASNRRTDADLQAIDHSIAELGRARTEATDNVAPDLAFHRAIAAATQNPYFGRFLDQLGDLAVPRRRLPASNLAPDYLDMVEREHQAIRDAIAAGDPDAAAAHMRRHLAGSRARYAALAS